MKKISIILLFLIASFVFSQNTIISGKITGFDDGQEIMLGDKDLSFIIEKSTLKNGLFSFVNEYRTSPKRYYLFINFNDKYYVTDFFAENSNIEITGDISDFPNNLKIKGSKNQDYKVLIEKKLEPFQIKIDSINKVIRTKKKDSITFTKKEIDLDRENRSTIEKKILEEKISFAKTNPNNIYSALIFFYERHSFNKKEIKKYFSSFDKDLKETQVGKNIKTYLDIKKVLQEGDYYEDFQAKDNEDKIHNLSDYIGKKHILLDFIQTYCYACVASLDDLKKINDKYQNELKIITFCGDKSEKTWKDGLIKHNINWLSLWNNEGLNGNFSQKYGTNGTPTFILINLDGKIIKKVYGYDEGYLDKLINEEINKK